MKLLIEHVNWFKATYQKSILLDIRKITIKTKSDQSTEAMVFREYWVFREAENIREK
jgi:hypothetical protein